MDIYLTSTSGCGQVGIPKVKVKVHRDFVRKYIKKNVIILVVRVPGRGIKPTHTICIDATQKNTYKAPTSYPYYIIIKPM